MRHPAVLSYELVKSIPNELEEQTLYVCMDYATVVHKCCCGCGQEVVTPLSPTDWKLIYDGESISLSPSIGNWGFECRSHYWIKKNSVRWAGQWSRKQIEAGRAYDLRAKDRYYADIGKDPQDVEYPIFDKLCKRLWRWVSRLWSS